MAFVLAGDELDSLHAFLSGHSWIAPDEKLLSASKPGEGNMNYTLRIRTNFRTFIVKQSRDYVEKYPQIPAPADRAVIEGQFYELIQEDPELRAFTPELNGVDSEAHVILLEDLGESSDYSFLYQQGEVLTEAEGQTFAHFLSLLHNRFTAAAVSEPLPNREMRALNAEHIFRYPLMEDNGFDLDTVTPGLQEVAMGYKTDVPFKAAVEKLAETYLSDGPYLLHGDYYPGSWLKTLEGSKVIDPEFCFFGPAEFDLSVMIAHMIMANQSEALIGHIQAAYEAPKGFDQGLCERLTGVEIMRRVIGLAQLPLAQDLDGKKRLLERAREMILG